MLNITLIVFSNIGCLWQFQIEYLYVEFIIVALFDSITALVL